MSSIFSSKANTQVLAVSLVVILLGAVLLIAYVPPVKGQVDRCLKNVSWEQYTEEQKRELPECEGNGGAGGECEDDPEKCNLPPEEEVQKVFGKMANWKIVTTYTDGDKDVQELGEFELAPGAVIGGQQNKEILAWDIILNYDVKDYAIKDVRIENAKMSFDSDVPSGEFPLDAGFKDVELKGPILIFNGINEPTISLDAFEDVEKPIVDALCAGGKIKGLARDCDIRGTLTVGAHLVIQITDTKDEVITLRADFGKIAQSIVVTDSRAEKPQKPDYDYKCDFTGKYGEVPSGPYAHQYKVNKNPPYQVLLFQAISSVCVKPVQECDLMLNEVWNSMEQKCETIVCGLGEKAVNARCKPIECGPGYYLRTDFELDPKTFRGVCFPIGVEPEQKPPECASDEVLVKVSLKGQIPGLPPGGEPEGWICEPKPKPSDPGAVCEASGGIWNGLQCLMPPVCEYGMIGNQCAIPPPPPPCASGFVLIMGECMVECSEGSWTIDEATCPRGPPTQPACEYGIGCSWEIIDPPVITEEERCVDSYGCVEEELVHIQEPVTCLIHVNFECVIEVDNMPLGVDELEEVTYCVDTNCESVGISIVETGNELETGYEQHRTEVTLYTAEAIDSPAVVAQAPIVCPSGYQRHGGICVKDGVLNPEYF